MNYQTITSPFMWCPPLLPAGLKDGNAPQSTATYMEINTPGHLSLGNTTNQHQYPQVFSFYVTTFSLFPCISSPTYPHPISSFMPIPLLLFGVHPCCQQGVRTEILRRVQPHIWRSLLIPIPLDVSLWVPV